MGLGRRAPAWLRTAAYATAAGCALAMLVGWVIWPPRYIDAGPALLDPEDRATYTELIAISFLENRDLATAQARLGHLGLPNNATYVETLAIQRLEGSKITSEARALAILALALGSSSERLLDVALRDAAP